MALNTYNKYNIASNRISSNLARLSSGLRINRAADDAAGLAISEKMKAQIAGLEQAARNAMDGNSLIMTAEGALSEVHSMLARMRELAVQAANDTYTSSDRMTIQNEIEQLKEEINRIASATQFNRKNLLDGTSSAIVSTDRLTTKVYMRDGLRIIDQFGQKMAGGGNYVIEVTAEAGQSQVEKSNILFVKHEILYQAGDALAEDMPLPDPYTLTESMTLGGEMELPAGAASVTTATGGTYAAGDTVPAGATLVTGSVLSQGTVIPAGTAISADSPFIGEVRIPVGGLADENIKLYDLRSFWDSNGNFLLEEPKTIAIMQGDGRRTEVTIYGSDTLGTMMAKLNKAIGEGLGQDALFSAMSAADRPYVSLVTPEIAAANTEGLYSVPGTIIIQSAVPGKGGALNFIGDDAIINSLGLSTVRYSSETKFTASVMDAHDSTKVIAKNVEFEGNLLVGILHPNVDVEISSTTALRAQVATGGTITWAPMGAAERTFIHLADRSMVFHVGPNSLQDVNAAIGNLSASALGLDGLLVTTNPLANKAIRALDLAIDKVSQARSKLGAIQNRLDHTVSNLHEMQLNLTAALSRIQDADMAKEMTEFTKNNIILQAATAMLAQANQLPQNVLQLLR